MILRDRDRTVNPYLDVVGLVFGDLWPAIIFIPFRLFWPKWRKRSNAMSEMAKVTLCNFCLKRNVLLFLNAYFIFREWLWKDCFIFRQTWFRPPPSPPWSLWTQVIWTHYLFIFFRLWVFSLYETVVSTGIHCTNYEYTARSEDQPLKSSSPFSRSILSVNHRSLPFFAKIGRNLKR